MATNNTSNTRPVNLDLMKISLPITAVASISHRVCAIITWVGLGIALFTINALHGSQQDGLQALAQLLADNFLAQFVTWGVLSAFGYYCAGTTKHLIQDFGYFEDLAGGKMISWAAIGTGVLLSIIAGVYVWA